MMNMNKWTMALAAAGVVSLSSVAQAQEAVAGADVVASSVELSGYVASSYTVGSHPSSNGGNTFKSGTANTDKFRMDIVSLSLNKAMAPGGESGFNVEMWLGPDASLIDTNDADSTNENGFALMEANIETRLDWGNGIDLKVGQFKTIVGKENYSYGSGAAGPDNAFYNRGWGFRVEPTHHTGVLANYQINDNFGLMLGAANDTTSAQTNATDDQGGSVILAGVTYNPTEGTWLADNGFAAKFTGVLGAGSDETATDYETDSYYGEVHLPVNSWMSGDLSVHLAADWVDKDDNKDSEIYQVYVGYKAGEKTTINARYEFGDDDIYTTRKDIESVAVGVHYDIWANVTSRLEYMTSDWEGSDNDEEALTLSLVYNF